VLTIRFDTGLRGVLLPRWLLAAAQTAFTQEVCSGLMMMRQDVRGLCSSQVLKGGSVQVAREHRESLKSRVPRLEMQFRREGVKVEVREYLRRCSDEKGRSQMMEEWCSIIGESEGEEVVLGSAFMRDYIITFDGTRGKVTLS
jgi:hypothetical protein